MNNDATMTTDRETAAIDYVLPLLRREDPEATVRKALAVMFDGVDADAVLVAAESAIKAEKAQTASFKKAIAAEKRLKTKEAKTAAIEAQAREVDGEPVNRPMTDLGNAERFADQHRGHIFFDTGVGAWRTYDGKRWIVDTSGATRLAFQTARSIAQEAADLFKAASDESGQKRAGAMFAWAMKSQGQARISAIMTLAQHLEGMSLPASAFDSDDMLLNVRNGTIDLNSGLLQPHDPMDFITKLADVEFVSGLRDERWERFLRESFEGDEESIAFAQKAAGYTLTGKTHEEKLFLLLGPAGTGKSTFIDGQRAAMGDYSLVADFGSFLKKSGGSGGSARPDIAAMPGARFVIASEPDEGSQLSSGLVKQLTGRDAVATRDLYKSMFSFTPKFKLWLSANHAPRVSDQDSGIWRRLLRLPFEAVPLKPDPTLKEWVKDLDGGARAVLSWAVSGCLLWLNEGLHVPARITAFARIWTRFETSFASGAFLPLMLKWARPKSDVLMNNGHDLRVFLRGFLSQRASLRTDSKAWAVNHTMGGTGALGLA
jgi:putative DNA primase/helicase